MQPVHLLYPKAYTDSFPPPVLSYLKHRPLQTNIVKPKQDKLKIESLLQTDAIIKMTETHARSTYILIQIQIHGPSKTRLKIIC